MADYINQKLIDEGNMSFQKDDYNTAGIKFQTTLSQLRRYDGDRMHLIMLASELNQKIEVCKVNTGKSHFNSLLR